MGVKHTVLPDDQPPTVAFTVHARLRGPKANETEVDAIVFTKHGEAMSSDFGCIYNAPDHFLIHYKSVTDEPCVYTGKSDPVQLCTCHQVKLCTC